MADESVENVDGYSLVSHEDSIDEIPLAALNQENTPQHVQPESSVFAAHTQSSEEPVNSHTLSLLVYNGEKHGEGINAFMTYVIKVKTTLKRYAKSEFTTTRRFKDFVWIQEELLKEYKHYIIPPLPEKDVMIIQDRFHPEFIEYRRKELEKFLHRIIDHPVLSGSKQLQTFLEAEEKDLQQAKAPAGFASQFASFFGSKVETISKNFSTAAEIDQWFEAKTKSLNSLETHLFQLCNAVGQLVKRHNELQYIYQEFGICTAVVSSAEVENDKTISDSFEKLSDVASQINQLQKELAITERLSFEDTIRDYVRVVQTVKEMLNHRLDVLADYQEAARIYIGKKEKLDKTKELKPGQTQPALETDLEKAHQIMEEKKIHFEEVSKIAKSEILRYEALKNAEISQALALFVQANINHELRTLDLWKKLISNIKLE